MPNTMDFEAEVVEKEIEVDFNGPFVTRTAIVQALGYSPANQTETNAAIEQLDEGKVSIVRSSSMPSEVGQYLWIDTSVSPYNVYILKINQISPPNISIVRLTTDLSLYAIAPAFSGSTSYSVGDYCIYQGLLYKCIVNHPAGTWNALHFTQTTVAAVLKELETRLYLKPGNNNILVYKEGE